MPSPSPSPSLFFYVPSNKVGLIIGKGGVTINDLQAQFLCKIHIMKKDNVNMKNNVIPQEDGSDVMEVIMTNDSQLKGLKGKIEGMIGTSLRLAGNTMQNTSTSSPTPSPSPPPSSSTSSSSPSTSLTSSFLGIFGIGDKDKSNNNSNDNKNNNKNDSKSNNNNNNNNTKSTMISSSPPPKPSNVSSSSPSSSSCYFHLLLVPSRLHHLLIGPSASTLHRIESQYDIILRVPQNNNNNVTDVNNTFSTITSYNTVISLISDRADAVDPSSNIFKDICNVTHYRPTTMLITQQWGVMEREYGVIIGTKGAKIGEYQGKYNVVIDIPQRSEENNNINVSKDYIIVEGGTESDLLAFRTELSSVLHRDVGVIKSVVKDYSSVSDGKQMGTLTATGQKNNNKNKDALLSSLTKHHTPISLSQPIHEVLFFPDHQTDDRNDPNGNSSCNMDFNVLNFCFSFDKFLNYLLCAKKTLDIAVYALTDDRVVNVLIDLFHYEKVKIRVITDGSTCEEIGSDVELMSKIGITVKKYIPTVTFRSHGVDHSPLMHHKFVVIDSQLVMSGSYNWSRAASGGNHENIQITNEVKVVKGFEMEFARMWEEKEMVAVSGKGKKGMGKK